jgi:predicted ATPase
VHSLKIVGEASRFEEAALITRLQVRNFRSLRDLEIRPGTNNVLVGPNAAGKSNILEVLRFLTHIGLVGLNKAFLNRNGYPEVSWKGKEGGPIYICVSMDALLESGGVREAEYEIEIEGTSAGLISVRRERLTLGHEGRKVNLIDLAMGHGKINQVDGSPAFGPSGNPAQSALEFNVPNWAGSLFKQHLGSWQFHRLVPGLMKQANPASRAPFLNEHGDNLGAWLATLKTSYFESFRRIQQVAKDAFPGLQELVPELTAFQTTFLSSREEYLTKPVSVWDLADGELCFVALASLILAPPELGAPLHCVEEPENHLHPRLLSTLVELLRQRQATLAEEDAVPAQVFVTTHSPHLVDQFQLDELVVVDKVEGQTRCARPSDKAHLRELLEREELGLGDLWYSGALGGV